MTREEAKHFWPIIKAYSEGKTIEYLLSEGKWAAINEDFLFDNSHERYRVKQETKYRPFTSKEECWEEMQKHQPVGWLIGKVSGSPIMIQSMSYNSIYIRGVPYTYEESMRMYTFADGAPFGIAED